MLQQAISLTLLVAMAAIPRAASQGIANNQSIGGAGRPIVPAVRVLVATPYPSATADSANAVLLGNALRTKLANNIGGSDWLVIPRREMNDNLTNKWGYSPDQIFSPETARQLVTALQARVFVMTTMSKTSDGRFNASVRVVGSTDEAGHVVKSTQLAGQTLNDFGSKLAEQVSVIFNALPDARSCSDQLATNKVKAAEGAAKAIKKVPNYGFPEYCLGVIEQAKDSTGSETLRHFANAVVGDPLSLKAVNQIAVIHARKHDSTAVVADYLQMLQIAPTNRELADLAVRTFQTYHRPDAAEVVVDAQIKLDPSSPDWPELKGNLCAAAGVQATDTAETKKKYKCAYDAFMSVYQIDPTRADTLFYPRMLFVAGNRADSAFWVKKWIEKYPSISDGYVVQLQMFMDVGETDSALKVVTVLSAIDPTNAKPTLGIVQAMVKAGKPGDALQFLPYFKKAEETPRNQYAGLLINGVQPLANAAAPADTNLIINLSQAIIDVAPTQADFLAYGNYFLSLGLRFPFADASSALRKLKSCDAAKAEAAILTRFEAALTGASTSSNAGVANFAKDFLSKLPPERKYVVDAVAKCSL